MKKFILFTALFTSISPLFAQKDVCEKIGMNLFNVSYWSREVPFSNLMMQAAPWTSAASDWQNGQPNDNTGVGNKLELDANGYPTFLPQTIAGQAKMQMAKTVIAWQNGGILPDGTYNLLYDGEGEIELYGLDNINILSKINGKTTFNLKAFQNQTKPEDGGALGVIIRKSLKTNNIRNIRVLLPNVKETDVDYPFNPYFLAKLKPFKTIRFMNWNAAYWSDERTWADHREPTYFTQFNDADEGWSDFGGKIKRSVSYEYQVKLCNVLDRDMWLNLPFGADSNYVYQVAKIVKNGLKPNLKVYIEYGNEVWNNAGIFAKQYNFVKNNAPSSLQNQDHQYRYAYFSNKIFKAFAAFKSAQSPVIQRIISGQQADKSVMERSIQGLAFIKAAKEFDMGSVTAYNYANDTKLANLTASANVSDIAKIVRGSMAESINYIKQNNDVLIAEGKSLVEYEGALNLFTNENKVYHKAAVAFLQDTSAYNIYKEFLQKITALPNLKQYMAFVLADGGVNNDAPFAHLQNIFKDGCNQLKYKALLDVGGVDCTKTTVSDNDILEEKPLEKITFFPNPTDGLLHFIFETEDEKPLEIFDASGRILLIKNINQKEETIDLQNFAQGIYFIKIGKQSFRVARM